MAARSLSEIAFNPGIAKNPRLISVLAVLLHRDLADLDGLVQQAEPDSRPQDPAHHFIDQLDPHVARLHRRQQALPPYTVPGELPVQSGVR